MRVTPKAKRLIDTLIRKVVFQVLSEEYGTVQMKSVDGKNAAKAELDLKEYVAKLQEKIRSLKYRDYTSNTIVDQR